MRICFFFHRFDGGGAERATICLANGLAERGHEVAIAVRYNKGTLKHTVKPWIKIIDMKLPEKGKIIKNVKNILYLSRIIKDHTFDVMVAVMSEMAQVAATAHYLCHGTLPLICVLHNTVSVEKVSFSYARHCLADFFDSQYAKVIAVSRAVEQDYLKYCKRTSDGIITIYNPVIDSHIKELAAVSPKHPWLCQNRKFKVLVLSGRLTYQKNHQLMFMTLKLLREKGDFRLILLGEGELIDNLKKMAFELEIHNWIDFVGFVDNPYSYMAHCDCVVLSSHYEGLPTVLIEALACGCRIVSVNCPSGPEEILQGGRYGILTKPNDPQALRDGILKAINSDLNIEILQRRAEEFSVESSILKYEEVFDEIVKTEC